MKTRKKGDVTPHTAYPPSAIMSVCPSIRPYVRPSVSQFVRFCFCDNFNTIKGMWMKPGMWQYVDYARICFFLAHLNTKCSW